VVMSPVGLAAENECCDEGRLALSSQRMLHKDYESKWSAKEKKIACRKSQGGLLLGLEANRPLSSNTDSDSVSRPRVSRGQ
jgi:hypothetical protein